MHCRLEVDLVLGSWAHKHVPELSEQGLQEFEAILKLETMDVFEWLTGRAAVPEVGDVVRCWLPGGP